MSITTKQEYNETMAAFAKDIKENGYDVLEYIQGSEYTFKSRKALDLLNVLEVDGLADIAKRSSEDALTKEDSQRLFEEVSDRMAATIHQLIVDMEDEENEE